MNVQFNTVQDKIKYALRDYTSIGKQSPLAFSFMTDEQVYQLHPERYAFYMQMLDALQDPSSGLLDRVLSIENKSRFARDKLQESSRDVAKALRYLTLNTKDKSSSPTSVSTPASGTPTPVGKDMPVNAQTKELITELNALVDASSSPIKVHDPQKGGSFYTDMLDNVESVKQQNQNDKNKEAKDLQEITDELDTHPIFSPDNEKISMTDRVIFIAVTFMIRGLALFLIDWGINSMLITTFNRAFLYYTLIYFTLFMMWALLVNAGTEMENIPLKMAFYYVNWGVHGIGRVLAHLAVQTFLIPIPFIVREPMQGAPDTATFEKRRAVYRVLSNFTFFVWVMTSVIALRY